MAPGANVIKLFTVVIFCHSMVMLPFCVVKQYNHKMAVNYQGKNFITLAHGGKLKHRGNLLLYFNPRKM
jgi:hypothetical protein